MTDTRSQPKAKKDVLDKARIYINGVRAAWPALSAKAGLDQHFLASDNAVTRELEALRLRDGARVAELGAGIGSVAQAFPTDLSLTLVELDPFLCCILKDLCAVRERTSLVQGDALAWLKTQRPDALLCNLPWELDTPLFKTLEEIVAMDPPKRVVAAVHPQLAVERLHTLCPAYAFEDLGLIDAKAFWPPQELPSRLVAASLRQTSPLDTYDNNL